jgi:hypothetical protein
LSAGESCTFKIEADCGLPTFTPSTTKGFEIETIDYDEDDLKSASLRILSSSNSTKSQSSNQAKSTNSTKTQNHTIQVVNQNNKTVNASLKILKPNNITNHTDGNHTQNTTH